MVNYINILPTILVNKIAAGEVVERPSSVVKELLENSIDALSTEISIFVKDAGKRIIKVVDNGIGMSESDALLSLERHATSKIKEESDLNIIRTLGFRGEALPSIAAVSQMTLKTRINDIEIGSKLEIEAGKVINISKVGIPVGTEIEVRNLFYNTPVRLKFLRSSSAELNNINDIITRLSLTYPHISFRFFNNDTKVIHLQKSGDILNRIENIFGNEFLKSLLPIEGKDTGTILKGFISKPNLSRNSRLDQYLFVNGRSIRDKTIYHAVMQGYGSTIAKEHYPSVFLFLEIDPSQIDVNIHPAKTEIKFTKPQKIHFLISKAISEALNKSGVIKSFINKTKFISSDKAPLKPISEDDNSDLFQKIPLGDSRDNISEILDKYFPLELEIIPTLEEPETIYAKENTESYISFLNLRILGQLKNSFILAESNESLVFIDQHAAHERILYSNLKNQIKENRLEVQTLLFPVTVELNFRDKSFLNEHKENLMSYGFEIDDFGHNTIIIKTVPSLLSQENVKLAIFELIDKMDSNKTGEEPLKFEDAMIKSIACHSAIKANQKLEIKEMKQLLIDMEKIKFSDSCPHGRPAIFELKITEIEKRFLRR